jgi:hypothetical protein
MQVDCHGMHGSVSGMHGSANGMQVDCNGMHGAANGMQVDCDGMHGSASGMQGFAMECMGLQTGARHHGPVSKIEIFLDFRFAIV